jgi:hypothetical protein
MFLAVIAGLFVIAFLFWFNGEDIEIIGGGEVGDGKASSIAGLNCDNYMRRPVSVMLASDIEARPLSGISQADMVFEMPVAPNGITRLMAVYQCESPKEIGSVRSARKDFIPLADGLKSIYAHWGGEHGVLVELEKRIIDNLNALVYDGTFFYRKNTAKPPHNGFTSYEKMEELIEKLDYDQTDKFEGYPHENKKPSRSLSNLADTVLINYPAPFDVKWIYNEQGGTYKRSKNGTPELDKSGGNQVEVNVVVVMRARVTMFYDQYMSVDVSGVGDLQVYQGGVVINGKWKKDALAQNSKLYFYDAQGKEIKFMPGKIWVQIVAN